MFLSLTDRAHMSGIFFTEIITEIIKEKENEYCITLTSAMELLSGRSCSRRSATRGDLWLGWLERGGRGGPSSGGASPFWSPEEEEEESGGGGGEWRRRKRRGEEGEMEEKER